MATVSASSATTFTTVFVGKPLDSARLRATAVPAAAGLPSLPKCRVTSSAERPEVKRSGSEQMALASALAAAVSHGGSAMALVDDRLSTEGTGLGLGISNPLLIWILLGVTTLIWALFFVYASSLPSGDDDSGLSL